MLAVCLSCLPQHSLGTDASFWDAEPGVSKEADVWVWQTAFRRCNKDPGPSACTGKS